MPRMPDEDKTVSGSLDLMTSPAHTVLVIINSVQFYLAINAEPRGVEFFH